jgi:hypothetical protein
MDKVTSTTLVCCDDPHPTYQIIPKTENPPQSTFEESPEENNVPLNQVAEPPPPLSIQIDNEMQSNQLVEANPQTDDNPFQDFEQSTKATSKVQDIFPDLYHSKVLQKIFAR